ncbi:AAA family ATPase [Methylocystis parvus]|uniref:AAA family ATPase n=1 Tax=Methylocystis parvus TaxID=134 RepID=UPI003C711132
MMEARSPIAPPDFSSWTQERRDDWFAEQARDYRKRTANDTPAQTSSRERKDQETPSPAIAVASPAPTQPPAVRLIQGSSITPEPIDWLWEGWLAAGKCHVLGGAPGAGKTTIAGSLGAIISTGGVWPDGSQSDVGNVVIWSGEDDPADTLTPRLIAAGADMSRVFFVGDVLDAGKVRAFDPSKDIEPLRSAIASAGGASMLIVDPLVSAIAGDSHKNAEVRRALQPLVVLASGAGAALVGITHFSKGTAGREPTERITGSLAFGALARIVLVAAKVPAEDEDGPPSRVFMRAKSNIGPDDGGYVYDLRQVDLEAHPGLSASCVQWGERIEGTAREVLQEAEGGGGREGSAVASAAEFLRALLAEGPMAATEVRAHAEGSGLSWAAVRRAQKALGIVSTRVGYGSDGSWEWRLPGH